MRFWTNKGISDENSDHIYKSLSDSWGKEASESMGLELLIAIIPKTEVKELFIELSIARHPLLMTFTRNSAYCLQAQYRRNHTCCDSDSLNAPVLAKRCDIVFLLNAQSTNTYHDWSYVELYYAILTVLRYANHCVNEVTPSLSYLCRLILAGMIVLILWSRDFPQLPETSRVHVYICAYIRTLSADHIRSWHGAYFICIRLSRCLAPT